MKAMRNLFTSVLALVCMASSAGHVGAANLIVNPGFESGALAPWAGVAGLSAISTITIGSPDNGPAAPGTFHAFLNNRAEANGLTMAQTTPLASGTPGTVFYSYDLKSGLTANGGVFFVEIFAQNAGGGVIGNAGLQGNYTPAGWAHFSGSFVAPVNTDHFTIQFEAPTGAVLGSTSSMQVDNVDLHQFGPVAVKATSWGRIKGLYR